jgi:rod shape-determining protein MreD
MTLLLAAVGAVVTALLELSVGPYLRIGDVQPHLVLVVAVVVTIAVGLDAGLTFAFVGGLALDVIAQRPLGVSAFALLICVGGASVLARTFSRLRPIVPIGAVFVLSIGYSMILFIALGALGVPLPVSDPLSVIIPGAVYDAVLALLIGPLVIAIHDRRFEQERVDW